MQNRRKIIIAWHYAGDSKKPLLFAWRGEGLFTWGCDYDVNKAAIFDSPEAAASWWLSNHAFPDDYRPCLYDGRILFFELTRSGMVGVLPLF